jgi:ATP sulfurylase
LAIVPMMCEHAFYCKRTQQMAMSKISTSGAE